MIGGKGTKIKEKKSNLRVQTQVQKTKLKKQKNQIQDLGSTPLPSEINSDTPCSA
jgi:hypothetical protein